MVGALLWCMVAFPDNAPAKTPTLNAPTITALRRIPNVKSVKVRPARGKATSRIIHILDWHYLPKEVFAADLRDVSSEPIGDAEIRKRYRRFLRDVERVQKQQVVVLHQLAKYGVRSVYLEGLTDKKLPAFRKHIATLRGVRERQAKG